MTLMPYVIFFEPRQEILATLAPRLKQEGYAIETHSYSYLFKGMESALLIEHRYPSAVFVHLLTSPSLPAQSWEHDPYLLLCQLQSYWHLIAVPHYQIWYGHTLCISPTIFTGPVRKAAQRMLFSQFLDLNPIVSTEPLVPLTRSVLRAIQPRPHGVTRSSLE